MYLNAETQSRILSRFHFALGDGGILFLGKAEMLLSHGSLFLPIDLQRRVFYKVPRTMPANGSYPAGLPQPSERERLGGLDQLRNEAFLGSPVAQIVVTSDGLVALTNRQAETLFGVSTRDVGRPFRDLDVSYRPVELRKYIEQAQVERRMTRVEGVDYQRGPRETLHLDVQLNPLIDTDSALLGVALIFHDVTAGRRLQEELEHANRQLETAYEELQSTNEELETTNEELQSTVEELETTNEELQSTNDELQNINELLRDRSRDLDRANAFQEAILTSLRVGVAVVNRDLQVQVWNRRAEDLWGLRREEVEGQHFLNLDIGLPTDRLRPLIRQALNGGTQPEEIQLPAVNRRGRAITVRVTCHALDVGGAEPSGAILLMDDDAGAQTD
jgi:two-component system CheB/CheR fusion protein